MERRATLEQSLINMQTRIDKLISANTHPGRIIRYQIRMTKIQSILDNLV